MLDLEDIIWLSWHYIRLEKLMYVTAQNQAHNMSGAINKLIPCLLRFASMCWALADRESMEFEWVHCESRDWGWGGSLRDRLLTSIQFTFMFGFKPATGERQREKDINAHSHT